MEYTKQFSSVHCNTMILYSVRQLTPMEDKGVQYGGTMCCTVLWNIFSMLQYNVVKYDTELYATVQYDDLVG